MIVLSYDQLRADTSSAHSFTLLKNFFTYVDDLESVSSSSSSVFSFNNFHLDHMPLCYQVMCVHCPGTICLTRRP